MSERLGLYKKLMLELNRAVLQKRTDEHELHQLFWECTLRCNLNCRHCGSDCRMLSEKDDMPFADFAKVLDEIREHQDPGKLMVITTGGEPTVRPDLAQCGAEISKRGFVWGMVCNGMLLSAEKLNEFMDAGLKSLAVSFDGFEEDHNWMRGNPNSYKNVLRAVEAMKQHPSLTWDVITCVNQRTIKYLPQFRDFLISLGIRRWRLFTVFPFGRAANEPDFKLSNEQFVMMMEFIRQTRLEGKSVPTMAATASSVSMKARCATTISRVAQASTWLRCWPTAPFQAASASAVTTTRAISIRTASGTCGKTSSRSTATTHG